MAIPKPDDWARWCEEAVTSVLACDALGPAMIALARMPTTLPDGYGAGGGGPKVTSEAELTRPENAANVRAFAGSGSVEDDDRTPTPSPDWVVANLGEAFRALKAGKAQIRKAERIFRQVDGRADSRVGRQPTSGGICAACQRSVSGAVDDRIRSGYCEACYSAWRRWQQRWIAARSQDMAADRLAFEHWRSTELHGACHCHPAEAAG